MYQSIILLNSKVNLGTCIFKLFAIFHMLELSLEVLMRSSDLKDDPNGVIVSKSLICISYQEHIYKSIKESKR